MHGTKYPAVSTTLKTHQWGGGGKGGEVEWVLGIKELP